MTGETEKPHGNELRSFGRKRSRKPSPRQRHLMDDVLPRLRLGLEALRQQPLAELFASPVTEVWLEIGFGGGEHLIRQASANPNVGLIGCEPFEDGVVKVLTAIEQRGLRNVRLHPDDARALLRALACRVPVDRPSFCFPIPGRRRATSSAASYRNPSLDGLAAS